jgi:type II secretory pathway pseudopilin PulG
MRRAAFTVLEMLICTGVLAVLFVLIAPAIWKVFAASSLAVSASNIRQLNAGGIQYLADNDRRFWKYREPAPGGTRYWFGFESNASATSGEGNRSFDPQQGPLAGYVPRGIRPDPSFTANAAAFKPKFKSGYLGVGYNVVLGGGWIGGAKAQPLSYWALSRPAQVVVFTTCAQANTFQSPASAAHPMLEEFYGIDQTEKTVHFRHGKLALAGFADGSCGFLPMDESTRDSRLKGVSIGRFAPVGSFQYLK